MSNIVDFLLNADIEELERPSTEVEIPRLSKLMNKGKKEGEPKEKFVLTCKALHTSKYEEIQNSALDMSNIESPKVDIAKLQYGLLLNGVFADDGTRFFSNKELHKKYKVPSTKEFIKKFLLPGEAEKVASVIQDLTGFGKDTVVEIKN